MTPQESETQSLAIERAWTRGYRSGVRDSHAPDRVLGSVVALAMLLAAIVLLAGPVLR